MLLVLLGLAVVDYVLASRTLIASLFTAVQALFLPALGVFLWRGLSARLRAMPVVVSLAVLGAGCLVLLARLELLLAADVPGRVAAYRTFIVVGLVVQGVGLVLRGDPLERALRLVGDHQARLMAASFGLAALVGALLLTLPQALQHIHQISFVDALFTATSALCVTGLSVNVVGQTYTHFGQAVILGLMECGGLGIMVLYSFFAVLAGQRLQLRRAVVMTEMIDTQSLAALRRTLVGIVTLALVVQGVGALILYYAFALHGPEPCGTTDAVWNAVFHAVSAYSNAGLSLYHQSLVPFARSFSVSLTIMALMLVGGIGFPVGFEVIRRGMHRLRGRRPERLSLHTRVVVWTTLLLVLGGAIPYLVLEWNRSMQGLDLGGRVLTALFQSVTTRSAGFNTLDFGRMAPATLFVSCALMFIGASPGSTGGGIKTTTFAVLLASFRAELQRREQVCLMGRAIPMALQRRALGVGFLGIVTVGGFTFLLLLTERHEPLKLLFEVMSALATTGLSTGITPELSVFGKILVILAMFVGRLGPLTVALAFARELSPTHTTLPEERLGIG